MKKILFSVILISLTGFSCKKKESNEVKLIQQTQMFSVNDSKLEVEEEYIPEKSDLDYFLYNKDGNFYIKSPMIPSENGH